MTNTSDGLKRLLHSRFNHYLHVLEQTVTSEIDAFADLARLQGISSIPSHMTSVHVIDCIGRHEPVNNTSIAEKMNLSKASITKISAKLLQEGFIKRSQLNDNKKEVYFSLSTKGRQIFEVHDMMHDKIEASFIRALDAFSEPELAASLKFIQTLIDQTDKIIKGEITL
ncbi:MarR family transcriptional regulator [Cohnella rhizosphaerae]|uniref:MarR family transcriptional regulator n=1 Tax=Cohnella rhizosphaerae TaxID=1457232 RepID=A0A9X4QTB6_9BACL|nr:MarR family transcriptional regulator [Cohnella rhizosphaerae]MDG0810520.1 MarR family transcriptional regulator [Cohnella rhizosphaerae]